MDRGNYRSVYSSVTIDVDFTRLSGGARGLWSLLVLQPSNGPSGIFYFPLSTLSEFSGYPPKVARKLFDELECEIMDMWFYLQAIRIKHHEIVERAARQNMDLMGMAIGKKESGDHPQQ